MYRKLFVVCAGLLAAGCSHTPKPGAIIPPPVRHVVLVHGFLETGWTFMTLRQRLEKRDFECRVPKLRPCDGRGGLEPLAKQLKQDIDAAYGPKQPVSIVAFSMGGLVARYYLQNLGGAPRCAQLITISSPHHGTDSAWYYPTKGAAQMRPGSRFLADLEMTQSRLGKMPVVSYRTQRDLVVVPPESSVWDRAVNLEYPVLLHALMLHSNAVLSDIERRLLESRPPPHS